MIVGLGLGITAASNFVVTAAAEVIRRKIGVSALGNAKVITSVRQFDLASAIFDGTGDYLQTTESFAIGTGNFTVECWIRRDDVVSNHAIFDFRDSATQVAGYLYASNQTLIWYVDGSARITSGNSLTSTTEFFHVAVSRSGTDTKMFIQGTQVGSTYTDTNNYLTKPLRIGAPYSTGADDFDGYIDEVRISKSARYTANFTPSTTPFVNDANTLLLLHMHGTNNGTVFEDDNGVRMSLCVEAVGNAQVDTAQSKFGGASLLLDGAGDGLQANSTRNMIWGSSGDFTYETWVRFASTAATYIFDQRTAFGTAAVALLYDANALDYYQGGTRRINYTWTPSTGVWYHIALVRYSGTTTLYVDGVDRGNFADTLTYVQGSGSLLIGKWHAGASGFNGHMDEIRVSDVARYTAGFTPPTAAFTNDSDTILLIHCNGTDGSTDFVDDNGVRAPIGLAAGNNAKISTAQSQFGGSSIEFDGTDDFVTVTGLPSYANSNYTFECWARFDILPHTQTIGGGSYMMMNFAGGGDYVQIYRSGAGSQVQIQIAHANAYGSFTKSGVNYAINTWYHIAVVRNSGVFKVFFNGTDLTTFTNDSGFTNSGRTQNIFVTQLGKFGDSRGSWDGYMDEIRISNTARYTGDYTPPTAPFVNDANTQLLIHADGTNGSTVFRDDNGVTPDHDYGA